MPTLPNKTASPLADRERYIPRGLAHYHPVVVESASGATLRGVDGREYLDFAGGIGVLNAGHCHPKVVKAVQEQAAKLIHSAVQVAPPRVYVEVCRKLVEAAPGAFAKKAVLLNTGAEAVETAVKLARAFTRRPGIVSFEGSFHGRTYMAMRLNGKHKPLRTRVGPFPGDVYHVPFPNPYRPPAGVAAKDLTRYCMGRLEDLLTTTTAPEEVAAVIIEPVQGEGGFIVPPKDFLPALRAFCDRHGILLIIDEVQAGFGRTGTLFACEQAGVAGDLLLAAKSIAAGLPLSAIVGRADVMDSLEPGGLGGTYTGNPLACAAALAVFGLVETEDLLGKAKRVGEAIKRSFDKLAKASPIVGESRGLGAMRAIELVTDKRTKAPLPEADMKRILELCREKGLLVIKAGGHGNVLRCLVPLTVGDAHLARGLKIIADVVLGLKRS
ncbi:MAG: aspartate aminotransferase family protein [Elusimicrobia bacterium]|nr:aspartate aminotransferase family protein [Elusimicrobiota bacterium]